MQGQKNSPCKYYPCHKGLTDEEFNCEYCYCPAYFVPNCGGNYKILRNGVKDCSDCTVNHTLEGMKIVDDIVKKERTNG